MLGGVSADKVVVVVQFETESVAALLVSLVGNHAACVARRIFNCIAELLHSQALELNHRASGGILFTVVERVVLLRNLQTEDGVAKGSEHQHEGAQETNNVGALLLVMHCGQGVGQLHVLVFVLETNRVGEVLLEVVKVHIVVVDERAAVLALGQEVEADVVPMVGLNLVVIVLHVREVQGKRHRQFTRFKHSHRLLVELIHAGVVVLVAVLDADTGGRKQVVRVRHTLGQTEGADNLILLHFISYNATACH